jgi:hypothetical protein
MTRTQARRTLVYVGPTISAQQVLNVLPDAELRAPVAAGDLDLENLNPNDRVALIDGVFQHKRAVRHKEIAVLLQRGVQVLGASSMGALRAVEMAPLGMVGIGTVVTWYRDGVIDGDDEVALLHADAEHGYRPMGQALVNLRASLHGAQDAGSINPLEAATLLAAWKALPYHQRDRPGLLAAAREQQPDLKQKAIQVLDDHPCDLKRQDAEALLTALSRNQILTPEPVQLSAHVRATQIERLIPWISWQVRDEPHAPSQQVADSLVLATARLLWDGFPALHRWGAVVAALRDAGIVERALPNPEQPLTLTPHQCQALLDLLQRRGWIDHPDDLPPLASPLCDDPGETDPSKLLVDLIARSTTGQWRMAGTLQTLLASHHGPHWQQVAQAAQLHLERIQQRKPDFQPLGLNPSIFLSWCQRHWVKDGAALTPEQAQRRWTLAMRDRGFSSEAKLVGDLAEVFPYAQMISDPLGLEMDSTAAQIAHDPDHHKRQRRRPQINQGPFLEAGDVGAEQQTIGGITGGAEGQGQG